MPTYPEASAFAVTSADGTPIAFDRVGEGPPLVVVGGILCDCRWTRPLAMAFSSFATVLNVDRRGRGCRRQGISRQRHRARPARHFGSSPLVGCAVILQERNDAEVLFPGRVKPGNVSIAAWATVMRFRLCCGARAHQSLGFCDGTDDHGGI